MLYKELKMFLAEDENKVDKTPIHSSVISSFLKQEFPDADLELLDDYYYKTCDYKTLKRAVTMIPIKNYVYRTSVFDCDDFSLQFRALWRRMYPRFPLGRARVKLKNGNFHDLCFAVYVTAKGSPQFTFIEPQTGKVSYFNYEPQRLEV